MIRVTNKYDIHLKLILTSLIKEWLFTFNIQYSSIMIIIHVLNIQYSSIIIIIHTLHLPKFEVQHLWNFRALNFCRKTWRTFEVMYAQINQTEPKSYQNNSNDFKLSFYSGCYARFYVSPNVFIKILKSFSRSNK